MADPRNPLGDLAADDVIAMSPQDRDRLRRDIAQHYDVRPDDVDVCPRCGRVHVFLHLICDGRDEPCT